MRMKLRRDVAITTPRVLSPCWVQEERECTVIPGTSSQLQSSWIVLSKSRGFNPR